MRKNFLINLMAVNAQIHNSQSLRRSEYLEYQPFKLSKVTEPRIISGKPFMALRYAKGLLPIPPESIIRGNLMNSLLPDNNVINPNLRNNCEVLIAVSMYNESSTHFANTMIGINENIETFHKQGIDTNKIACIIIIDGIKAFLDVYNRERFFFSEYFDEDKVKQTFHVDRIEDCVIPEHISQDEFAHCFMQSRSFGYCETPVKIIFCVKQYNKRKLNTHLWLFGGFCMEFQPKYVVLLDVGTKPLPKALFYLYEAMECNSNLAGCCGEIKPMDPNFWKLVGPAQVLEYKFSHMMDKAFESIIGFLTVLPGAFSAYR